MIKSISLYNLHPLMKKIRGNKILDYRNRTRIDEKYIPQYFNNEIKFISYKSFQQNNLVLSKQIRKFVSENIKNNIIAIGGEGYLYNYNCYFYTNSKSIIDDATYNGYNHNNLHLIDYNEYKFDFNIVDNILLNLSRLNENIVKQINLSLCNTIIIISCHHKDFWKKIKLLTNYKLCLRKKFIDWKSKYFITVNILKRKSFIPLGGNCSITYWLNEKKLRVKAFPYDWCQIKITQVINSLLNDFKDYSDIKIIKNSKSHNSYLVRNKYGKFSHEIFDGNIKIFEEKIKRRINRFSNYKNPHFIRIEIFKYRDNRNYINYCNQLINILEKLFGNFEFTLISKINPKNPKIRWFYLEDFSEDWKYSFVEWDKIFL